MLRRIPHIFEEAELSYISHNRFRNESIFAIINGRYNLKEMKYQRMTYFFLKNDIIIMKITE